MKDLNKPQGEELRSDNNVSEVEEVNENAAAENENKDTIAKQEDGAAAEEKVQATESAEGAGDEKAEAEAEAGETDGSADGEEPDKKDKEGEKPSEKIKKFRRDLRRLRYGGMATATTAVAIAVVVLINVIAGILNDRFPFNIDLTPDKLFTLSDDSKKLAKDTEKDTEVIVFAEEANFYSPSTEEDAINKIFKQFYETAKQYESLSGGKIKVSYIDLAANPTAATRYAEFNVNNGDILFRCGERWQKSSINELYSFDEQSYYLYNVLTNVYSKVEDVMSSNIAMVTSDYTPLVTILTGHDEDGDLIGTIESLIKNNNYETTTLNITGSAKFDEKSVMAIIAAPQTDYSDDEIEKLRTWLNNGGNFNRHLAVFVDYRFECPNLFEFLNVEYGLEVTDNLVFETDPNRMYSYYPQYIFGDIQSSDFTGEIADKKALMPVVRQILTHKESSKDYSLYNIDLVTFPESSKLVKLSDALDQDRLDELKQVDADEYPVTGAAYATKWGYVNGTDRVETNVFVSGCFTAFTSNIMQLRTIENEALLLSVFNGFTGNESPITISSKPLDKARLEFTTGQQQIFLMVFVVAIPVILLISSLVVFMRRRRL